MRDKINKTIHFAKETFKEDSSGHDWWHTHRVSKLAKQIAVKEKADLFIVEMAALLHDISDFKFNSNIEVGKNKVISHLKSLGIEGELIDKIWSAVETVSFRGANVLNKPTTLEGMVVQDADRLDALGAIGIARTFAYGAHKGRAIYDPEIKPTLHKTADEYLQRDSSSINHFYEKLFLLKEMVNTETAKKIAKKRHDFLKIYLKEFLTEWNGEDIK